MITESTSLLISQLISLDPSGPARQPPDYVMDQLKTLNEKYKLGKHLCQCRDPDFLLSIIQNQVTFEYNDNCLHLLDFLKGKEFEASSKLFFVGFL